MRYLSANAQHVGAREYQQDFFGLAGPEHAQMEPGQRLADPQFAAHAGFLAVLCDGMGGMAHGDVASKTAVQSMLRAYARKTPQESIPDALERSVREANQQVLIAANDLGMPEAVGTTLVAAVLHTAPEGQEFLYFASVGDSGLFHVTGGVSGGLGGGQLHTVNQPHVYANVLDRAVANGAISQQQAEQHPERESLTSFVGIQNLTEIDRNTEPWPVAAGDTILLASDGMFKTLEAHEIAAALDGDPRRWPQTLVDQVPCQAKARAGQRHGCFGDFGQWMVCPVGGSCSQRVPGRATFACRFVRRILHAFTLSDAGDFIPDRGAGARRAMVFPRPPLTLSGL